MAEPLDRAADDRAAATPVTWPQGPATWPQGPATPAPARPEPGKGETPGARAARLTGGWVLIALGAWLLLAPSVHVDWNLLWPVFVMGAGVLLIVVALRRRSG